MNIFAAPSSIVVSLLLLACHPAPPVPPQAAGSGNADAPEGSRQNRQVPYDARQLPRQPVCTPSAQEPLGDIVRLGVGPGDWGRALDDVTRARSERHVAGWVEVERVVWPDYAFVALELPGNDAALVMLAPVDGGYCVRAVWGFSFGGNGVTLAISDAARAAGGTFLVALESVAQYNNPVDSTDDPFEHRRIVLAVAEARAAVIADTYSEGPFARYDEHHWYFTDTEIPCDLQLVATDIQGSKRWCFDKDAWTFVPLPSRPA